MTDIKMGYRYEVRWQPQSVNEHLYVIVDLQTRAPIAANGMRLWIGDRAQAEKKVCELNAADWLANFEAALR